MRKFHTNHTIKEHNKFISTACMCFQLLGSTEEIPVSQNKLSLTETIMALTSVNRELQVDEQHYLIRVNNFNSFSANSFIPNTPTTILQYNKEA